MSAPKQQSLSSVKASGSSLSKNKFEFVKGFEVHDVLWKNTWIVVRLDGRNFHKFAEEHSFMKPNDSRALDLMNRAAVQVMRDLPDIAVAYGQSDEYSFVIRKETTLHQRHGSKISAYISSAFTASFVYHWKEYFDEVSMKTPPVFDANLQLYPSVRDLRDYLSWRQCNCHLNNLYNTTFWALVEKGGLSISAAEERLLDSTTADKNEILFSQFGVNYNKELDLYKKGTTLLRKSVKHPLQEDAKVIVVPLNVDLTSEAFWTKNTEVLDDNISSPGAFDWTDDFLKWKVVVQQLNVVKMESKDCL